MGMSNRISIRQRQAKNTLLHIILEVPENYPWFRVIGSRPPALANGQTWQSAAS
jgi:hypothetical protein